MKKNILRTNIYFITKNDFMEITVSIGEIVDKATILEIKLEEIKDTQKLYFIKKEYSYLVEILSKLEITPTSECFLTMKEINKRLWEIEDDIRDKERNKSFDDTFIFLAREVYKTNDKRAEIKKDINIKYNSEFVEQKSYSQY